MSKFTEESYNRLAAGNGFAKKESVSATSPDVELYHQGWDFEGDNQWSHHAYPDHTLAVSEGSIDHIFQGQKVKTFDTVTEAHNSVAYSSF